MLQDIKPTKYYKYPKCEDGDVLIEGKYVKSEEGKFGIQHFFMSEDGQTVCLNKAGMLDKFVENSLWPGRKCRITYTGKHEIEKGAYAGKEAHTFLFAVDPNENPIFEPEKDQKLKTVSLDDLE